MRISHINFTFLNSNTIKISKQNVLTPLKQDTFTFSAKYADKLQYSTPQKEEEIALLEQELNKAIAALEYVDSDELSKRTGLDPCIVKLRLSATSKVRTLYNKLKLEILLKARKEKEEHIKKIQSFFEKVKTIKKKLTSNEIAFYVGLKKGELSELLKEYPTLSSLYDDILLETKPYSTVEKKERRKTLRYALKNSDTNPTYEAISKKTKYTIDTIRETLDREDNLFDISIENHIYPPEIYSKKDIEKQEFEIMNLLIFALKHQREFSIEEITQKTSLLKSIVEMRIFQNEALLSTYKRMLGIDEDE